MSTPLPLRVYAECAPTFGQGIHRVVRELKAYAPAWVQFVDAVHEAELVVHHIVGVGNFHPTTPVHELIEHDYLAGRAAAAIQYCVATTEQPSLSWWHQHVWRHCVQVWSYYDLRRPNYTNAGMTTMPKWFYRAPLGVSRLFHWHTSMRTPDDLYLVGTSGYIAETECVDAWAEVCAATQQYRFHLGPKHPGLPDDPTLSNGITDEMLGAMWASCRFVNGLRAVEGFELPAAEGLVCGARPVLFDRPHHREWFHDHAIYLDEHQPVVPQLMELVARPYADTAVSNEEREWARAQFSWPRLVEDWWLRINVSIGRVVGG